MKKSLIIAALLSVSMNAFGNNCDTVRETATQIGIEKASSSKSLHQIIQTVDEMHLGLHHADVTDIALAADMFFDSTKWDDASVYKLMFFVDLTADSFCKGN